MSARRPQYVCSLCGAARRDFKSQCHSCGKYRTLIDIKTAIARGIPVPVALTGATKVRRMPAGLDGLDFVLGGGIPEGSLMLISGPPGGGKSTLAIQAAGHIARRRIAIVASWEQDVEAVGEIVERLGMAGRTKLAPACPANLSAFASLLWQRRPACAVADSIPEIAESSRVSAPDVVQELRRLAHASGTAILGIVHLNSKGEISGPRRTLYRGDSTVHLDGDPGAGPLRILRTSKNRGGPSDRRAEVMLTAAGFVAHDPGAEVLSRRSHGAGSALGIVLDSQGRPTPVEVQALIAPNANTNSSAARKVSAIGLDQPRSAMLVQVIERAGIKLAGDVTIAVADGLATSDRCADAAVVAALTSAASGKPTAREACFVGELGLTGEVRPPRTGDPRLAEAQRLGLRVMPLDLRRA